MVLSTPATNTVAVQRNVEATATTTYNMTTSASNNGLACLKIGNAMVEDSTSRVAKQNALLEKYNYVQIFEEPCSVSDLVAKSKYHGPDEMERRAKNAFIDHLRGIEGAMLWNHRAVLTVDGDYQYLMGGVEWHMNYADTDNGTAAHTSTTDLVEGDGTSRIWRPGANFSGETW